MASALKLLHWTGQTRVMREHSLFISETSLSSCCSKQVRGLAALASSESLLDTHCLAPPLLLDQNVHFNKIPGDTYTRLILKTTGIQGKK